MIQSQRATQEIGLIDLTHLNIPKMGEQEKLPQLQEKGGRKTHKFQISKNVKVALLLIEQI